MSRPPPGRSARLALSAAGFMATSTSGASPGVMMSWSAKCSWKELTPGRVPVGARISAGKLGSVDRSLPKDAVSLVKRLPVSCIPSPESPASRMTTRSSATTLFTSPPGADPLSDRPLAVPCAGTASVLVMSALPPRRGYVSYPPGRCASRHGAVRFSVGQPAAAARHSPVRGRGAGNGRSGGSVHPGVHHWTNGLKTAVLLGAMGALILLAGQLIGGRRGLLIALVVALAVNGYAYLNSDKLALRAMRAFPVTETPAPALYAIVLELATQA